jgi:hypothetical protein
MGEINSKAYLERYRVGGINEETIQNVKYSYQTKDNGGEYLKWCKKVALPLKSDNKKAIY